MWAEVADAEPHLFCRVMTEIITSVIGLFPKTCLPIQRASIPTRPLAGRAVDQDERKIKLYIEELLIERRCI